MERRERTKPVFRKFFPPLMRKIINIYKNINVISIYKEMLLPLRERVE